MENQTREEAAAILRQGGMRITRQRQLVMAALLQAGGPLTAEAVAEQSGDPTGCNRSTVYRTLAALEGRGLVYRRLGADGSTLYALRREHHGIFCTALSVGEGFPSSSVPWRDWSGRFTRPPVFWCRATAWSLPASAPSAGRRSKNEKRTLPKSGFGRVLFLSGDSKKLSSLTVH